jgi:hypothetical protein
MGIYPNVFLGRNFGNAPPSAIGPSGAVISAPDRATFETLYNHLLGRVESVSQTFNSNLETVQPPGTPRVRNNRFVEYAGFVQDDWRIARNLTLNLGLRYEFNGVPSERDGLQGTLDKADRINFGSRMADLRVVRTGRWFENDFNNFAPRVGLAWDPRGNGKTAVRAGYGIFYERMVGGVTAILDSNTPGFVLNAQTFPNSAAGSDLRVSDGIPLPAQPAAPDLRPPVTRGPNIAVINPRLRTGYVQQYSLTVQRELFRNTVIEAGLVGNRGVKLFMYVNPNQPRVHEDFLAAFREIQAFQARGAPVPNSNALVRLSGSANAAVAALNASTISEGSLMMAADIVDRTNYSGYAAAGLSDFYLRNFPQFNVVFWGTNDGRSHYDSLQVSLRRQSGALKFVANYTWSKTLDLVSSQGGDMSRPIDSFNLRLNRGRSDIDRAHVFNGSFLYTLPLGKARRIGSAWPRWLDSMAGGWDVGVLGLWESGQVFPVLSGRRTAGDLGQSFANYSQDRNIGRVDRRGNGVYWFSPEEIRQFSLPAAGEIGTAGRNVFRGPRHFDVDASLVKRFRITERQSLGMRAEFYNVFNNPNFAVPGVSLATPASFGRISATASGGPGIPVGGTAGGPRTVQIGLRYEF